MNNLIEFIYIILILKVMIVMGMVSKQRLYTNSWEARLEWRSTDFAEEEKANHREEKGFLQHFYEKEGFLYGSKVAD